MNRRLLVATVLLSAIAVLVGCSATSAGWTGLGVGKNIMRKDTYLKIFLDGHEAKQSFIKKAAMGYAQFEIKETVGTKPTFRFEFKDPSHFGRIKSTNIQVHQEYEADYSHAAEFVICAAKNDSMMQMKPNTDYDLGQPGADFRVFNFEDQEVSGLELKPGLKYMFLFTVSGDRSETCQIFFTTK
ncbi:MAG: hypothetical protein JXO22_01665 [Phycisphaerae bacterium]|nr:hypothetical protein [Phycisphaerae bacterium]